MKKILIINTTFNKGGAARVAGDLFEHAKKKFDVYFAYGRGPAVSDDHVLKFSNRLETLIHVVLVRLFGLEGFGSYFSTSRLIRFIKKEKFDLINIHNLHGYYLNFFQLIAFIQKEKIPVIWTMHDEWPLTWLPAHSLTCTHCKSGIGKCINTYSYPKNYFPLFTRYMLRRKKAVFGADWRLTITCPSNWLANQVRNSFFGNFPIKIIPNGVDTDTFKPVMDKKSLRIKYGLSLDKKIIIFLASNLKDESKGVKNIIEAAKILDSEKYHFIGLGAGSINNAANIRYIGYVYDKKTLAELYALSDIHCVASIAETFLLTAAEALACGTPVIGYDIPVVREIVNDEVGFLLKERNEKKYAAAIESLAGDKGKLLSMREKGRKLITDNYSCEQFYANYDNLYNESN